MDSEQSATLLARATEVALAAGAIKRCAKHPEVTLDTLDPARPFRAHVDGVTIFNAGGVEGSRQEFLDAIKAAIDASRVRCAACNEINPSQT